MSTVRSPGTDDRVPDQTVRRSLAPDCLSDVIEVVWADRVGCGLHIARVRGSDREEVDHVDSHAVEAFGDTDAASDGWVIPLGICGRGVQHDEDG